MCIGYVVFVCSEFEKQGNKAGRQTEQTTPGRQITPDSVHVHQTQTAFLFPLCRRLITLVFVSQLTSLFVYFVQVEAMVQGTSQQLEHFNWSSTHHPTGLNILDTRRYLCTLRVQTPSRPAASFTCKFLWDLYVPRSALN